MLYIRVLGQRKGMFVVPVYRVNAYNYTLYSKKYGSTPPKPELRFFANLFRNISTKNETKISITIFQPLIFFGGFGCLVFRSGHTTTPTLPSRHVGSAFQPWWRRFKVPKDPPMMSSFLSNPPFKRMDIWNVLANRQYRYVTRYILVYQKFKSALGIVFFFDWLL